MCPGAAKGPPRLLGILGSQNRHFPLPSAVPHPVPTHGCLWVPWGGCSPRQEPDYGISKGKELPPRCQHSPPHSLGDERGGLRLLGIE